MQQKVNRVWEAKYGKLNGKKVFGDDLSILEK